MATPLKDSTPYDLHPSVAYVQAILANLEARTGRSLEAWVDLARKASPAETKARRAWLTKEDVLNTAALADFRRAIRRH